VSRDNILDVDEFLRGEVNNQPTTGTNLFIIDGNKRIPISESDLNYVDFKTLLKEALKFDVKLISKRIVNWRPHTKIYNKYKKEESRKWNNGTKIVYTKSIKSKF
jgi:hypothetical protein